MSYYDIIFLFARSSSFYKIFSTRYNVIFFFTKIVYNGKLSRFDLKATTVL